MKYELVLPSKPKIIKEENNQGIYEIEGLYPGYGHTFGNSLRRILLSSLAGGAITKIKIKGVSHEFSVVPGVKEDIINIILNLKNLRLKILSDEPQTITLKEKGPKEVRASDLKVPSQVEIVNPELVIATITGEINFEMELQTENGIGYAPREELNKEKVEVGTINLDAFFSPVKLVSYDVENMRVGERTDFNRLKIEIETDGTIAPREALEKSIDIMIKQLRAIVGFKKEEEEETLSKETKTKEKEKGEKRDEEKEEKTEDKIEESDILKFKAEELGFSPRILRALEREKITTVNQLTKQKEEDLLKLRGIGKEALGEIKKILAKYDLELGS
ncbi:MAG: DNA-directed RNA polymerase subunit alpha [Candidatus Niyogibacteria bacterium RIFCSPLOWO2_12_FULL_41_13]|uniref:DNA-directed RNA polymerase subunit alpha n=1 Tax=Candidatus Niyogibacteria bacterium RIFCSPLOWO2_12_FULL_41_13 TaxID=1801726 RepID=A0A1G2F2Q3_9BACT|nr:MAG: DNA-directed RNA polymerase subunit alpha [Candidatus Niyogibacteria bacterium RIFCSPLOWO2_12_FULL_41_13]